MMDTTIMLLNKITTVTKKAFKKEGKKNFKAIKITAPAGSFHSLQTTLSVG